MKRLLSIAMLAAVVLAGRPLAWAADDKPAQTPKTEKEKKVPGLPFNGKISAVDNVAKTITLGETEKARVYQITSDTRIFKNKKPTTLDNVLVGENVGGYARKNAEGKQEVVTLNTGLPPRNAKAKPADKKPEN